MPHTYDLIQTLLKFNRKSPYNKMSMIANFIRLEVIYKYGGFYLDTNYMFLKKHGLDDFLTYKFFVSS